MSKVLMCDPPSGWKYGFPKPLPDGVGSYDFDLMGWLLDEGYPQSEIDACGNHFYCRYWEGGNRMIEYKVEVDTNGTKCWYLNGKFHREDGPAIEYADGDKRWYLNGNLHREDGPAVEDKCWYLNGKELTEQEHKKAMTKPTCSGKEVVIDGVTYVLKEK